MSGVFMQRTTTTRKTLLDFGVRHVLGLFENRIDLKTETSPKGPGERFSKFRRPEG